MKRKLFASRETELVAKNSEAKFVRVYSFMPIDKANCACVEKQREWNHRLGEASPKERQELLAKTPFIECPRDKTGMERYEVHCNKCGDLQGYLWTNDLTLNDWCDFHYVQWTEGDVWRGCFTPHISPITQQLLFECCCGNDTRDFRANMTINQEQAEDIEKVNAKGREMDEKGAKFSLRKVID